MEIWATFAKNLAGAKRSRGNTVPGTPGREKNPHEGKNTSCKTFIRPGEPGASQDLWSFPELQGEKGYGGLVPEECAIPPVTAAVPRPHLPLESKARRFPDQKPENIPEHIGAKPTVVRFLSIELVRESHESFRPFLLFG